ncbi:MAG: methionyl-tRNA formyltransferase [Gammaproteobacteria bacterium]|nr:methionyl-tRNA formyltransferase [Gammaproteobacteria bacterium]
MTKLKLGFAGSPAFAVSILAALVQTEFCPIVVFTQPPKPTGRGQSIRKTPVHDFAESSNISVKSPLNIANQLSLLTDLDLLVVAAYGQILPESVIRTPRFGCVNVHPSLLPRWRGATPVEHTILSGDSKTGVSIMQIVKQLDAGPVYAQCSVSLTGHETTRSLTKILAQEGAQLLIEHLSNRRNNSTPEPRPQDSKQASYAKRLTKEDARINWLNSATQIDRQIRAFYDHNPAFTSKNDVRIRILNANVIPGSFEPGVVYCQNSDVLIGTAEGGIQVHAVQLNLGKGIPMSIEQAKNGYKTLFTSGVQFET